MDLLGTSVLVNSAIFILGLVGVKTHAWLKKSNVVIKNGANQEMVDNQKSDNQNSEKLLGHDF
jgi:hypothetical protein